MLKTIILAIVVALSFYFLGEHLKGNAKNSKTHRKNNHTNTEEAIINWALGIGIMILIGGILYALLWFNSWED